MTARIALAALAMGAVAFGSAASSAQTSGGRPSLPPPEAEAAGLMSAFAERTSLTSKPEPQRYLWTDAFAVYNHLDLWRETGDPRWRRRAEALITQVHDVLGRHRPDDPRTGWLSGLPEAEGALHPTRGGLRIGKPLPERGPEEPYDERLEWDRDGQYFHYLTKWMEALLRASVILNEPRHLTHAVELAEGVFPRFLQRSPSGEPLGLAWKMSVDLSRPQVAAMSPHDALDGYVTFRRLAAADESGAEALEEEIDILRRLSTGHDWTTSDPLGIGGLLLDAFRLAILPERTAEDEALLSNLLAGADAGLQAFLRSGTLEAPPSRRLAFRELGLAIGLQTLPAIAAAAEGSPELARAVEPWHGSLRAKAEVGRRIVEFWSDPERRDEPLWREHHDIDEVMLAAALLEAQVDTALAP